MVPGTHSPVCNSHAHFQISQFRRFTTAKLYNAEAVITVMKLFHTIFKSGGEHDWSTEIQDLSRSNLKTDPDN